ncbi:MAG: cell division protein FtsQ/DivIB [Bacteroidia bacterium]
MFKKILYISGWVVLLGGMLGLLGFAEVKRNTTPCRMLDIRIMQRDSDFFITPGEVRSLIVKQQGNVVGKAMYMINTHKIEEMLGSNPFIADAQVYATLDGDLEVRLVQKKPIARIINSDDESYYIDSAGSLVPLSANYTPKVVIVNGNFNEPYSMYKSGNVKQMAHDTSVHSLLPSIYRLASYIRHNPFWNSQVTQVYVDTAKDFCLVPRVGNQKIIFGDTTNMEQKFNRLWVLYHDGLNATGKWNDYSVINLKYNHQIVCTKK